MAILIPISKIRRHYRNRFTSQISDGAPFVHHLNASFSYCSLLISNQPIPFTYNSRYNGCNNRERTIGITPYLLKFKIGRKSAVNYAIVLIATINKYFPGKESTIRDDEWCTPYDLVYLRRAIFESGNQGLKTAQDHGKENMHDWLTSLICKVSGLNQRHVDLSRITTSTNITVVGIDTKLNDVSKVKEEIVNQYYTPTHYRTIDDFLAINFNPVHNDSLTTDAARFIHGYLYCNENFMQLHHNSVRPTINGFYSNNRVEGYWAVEDHILSVKIATPFINQSKERKSDISSNNSLNENECLKELCVLSMLDKEIEQFSRRHNKMKTHEIELCRAQIVEYFNERIINVWELDHRMDYFLNRFKLDKRFRRLLDVAIPRGNARNVAFTQIGSITGWAIAFLALIVAILTLLKP